MSKQTKIIMLGLTALLGFSLILNMVQCSGSTEETKAIADDSLQLMKDSVVKQNAKIEMARTSILEIDKQVSKISASNIAPVDSIKKIIKKNK